jgi:hypothetical protein
MANLSDYLELEIIKWAFATATPVNGLFIDAGGVPRVAPTGAFVALWENTATLSDASTGATAGEPATANGYARQSVLSAGWSGTAEATENLAAINFGPNTVANWNTINQVGITDNATRAAGNMWFWGSLGTPLVVVVNDTVQFAIGALDISIDTAAGEMSNYLEKQVMDFLFHGVSMPARPTTLHMALFNLDPTDADTVGTEVNQTTHPSYARVSMSSAVSNTVWTNAANTVSNAGAAGEAVFPQALTTWGTPITHVGLYDAAYATQNSGNLLFYTPVTNVTVNVNDTLRILAGNFTVQVDN